MNMGYVSLVCLYIEASTLHFHSRKRSTLSRQLLYVISGLYRPVGPVQVEPHSG